MAFILGRKLGMSQVFSEDGRVIPVTVIEAGPIFVTQVKTKETDGYEAVQIGYGIAKKTNKAKAGHLKKAELDNLRTLREFRTESDKHSTKDLKPGDKIDVSIFEVGASVKVSGITKAKGFQGVVKRHGFGGAPASHGHHAVLRHGGSIGQRFPQHTLKGMKMPGRMGGVRVTSRGLRIVSVDPQNNIIAISGAVPGSRGTLLEIQTKR